MYPFPPLLHPILRWHLDAQAALFDGLSLGMLRSFQQACQLNMQLGQTLFEGGSRPGRHVPQVQAAPAPAEAVTHALAEETSEHIRQQEGIVTHVRDPLEPDGTRVEADAADAGVQADEQPGHISAQGYMQGNKARQAAGKHPGQMR